MRKLKLLNAILVTAALVIPIMASGKGPTVSGPVASDPVSFYEVPLKCPAAPRLACGGRAKPVLFALERRPAVVQAWVNRTGTVVAVVWKADSTATEREAVINDIASLHELSFRELTKEDPETAGRGFVSRTGWYRSMDTDKLSEDEAHVIAERLVRRLMAKAPTAASKAESLTPVVFKIIQADLVPAKGKPEDRADVRNQLLAAARVHLDTMELSAFEEAIAAGYRPVGNEP
jgi:hypothetical protein